VLKSLFQLLVRLKGKRWVAITGFRIYRRMPPFARRRVRKALWKQLPKLLAAQLSRRQPPDAPR
jgi:hypothetical protein